MTDRKTVYLIPPEFSKGDAALQTLGLQTVKRTTSGLLNGVWQRAYTFRTMRDANRFHAAVFGYYYTRAGKRCYEAPSARRNHS